MNDYTSRKGLSDLLKIIGGLITAIAGVATCLITFVKLLQGNAGFINLTLLISGAVTLWGSLWYIYLLRKGKTRQTAGITAVHLANKYFYSDRSRSLALAGIIGIPLLSFAGFDAWEFWKLLQPDKTIILVADFQSLDQQNYGVTETIIEQLRDATREYSDVQIRPLAEVISVQQGSDAARAKVRAHEADIVVWGWYRRTQEKVHISVHYEGLKIPRCSPLRRERREINISAEELESFEIQTQLSNEMTYLTLLTIGLTRLQARDFDGAITRLTHALSLQHAAPDQMINPADIYIYRSEAYLRKGDYDRAINDYDQLVKLSPDNFCAYVNRAYAYLMKGDYDLAIASSDSAIEIKPDNAAAFYNRANSSFSKGSFDNAISDFNRFMELKPDDASAYTLRGASFYFKEDYDRALSDLNHAVHLDSGASTAYYIRGLVHDAKGDYDSAIREYSKTLELAPDNEITFLRRGFAHYRKKNYNYVIQDLSQAIKLKPGLVNVHRLRGWAYMYTGDGASAAADAHTYISLKGWHGESSLYMAILGHLGYRMVSRNTEARNILDEAVVQGNASSWPYPIIRHLQHEITARDLITLATDDDKMTEARSYIGMNLLLAGNRDEALHHFKWVEEYGNKAFVEYDLALVEIRRIVSDESSSDRP